MFWKPCFGLVLCAGLYLSCKPSKSIGYNYLTHTASEAEIAQMPNKIDKVYHLLTGHFSNKAQADTSANGLLQEQEIIAVPIWRKRTGEYWLYMGWFAADAPDKPLAQGIFQLSRKDRDTFLLKFYLPPDEQGNNFYAGEFRKEKPFDDLMPRDLVHDPGCVNYIVERADNTFEVISEGDYCKRYISDNIRYFDFLATLQPDIQIHFTQFFNENKELVFAYPRPAGLRYKRLDKTKPKYNNQ